MGGEGGREGGRGVRERRDECYTRAVYSERNQSSIITLSILMRQVTTQKQNDPTNDALC